MDFVFQISLVAILQLYGLYQVLKHNENTPHDGYVFVSLQRAKNMGIK
jgi:hypothetical protein